MEYTKISWLLLLFVIIVICLSFVENEGFHETSVKNIDFYVITMGPEDRLKNIAQQTDNINSTNFGPDKVTIEKIDAVVGASLNLDDVIARGILMPTIHEENTWFNDNPKNKKNEIGCYMSHLKAYNTILEKKHRRDYSVIFEDDFNVNPYFLRLVNDSLILLKDIDFDILVLGAGGGHGEQITENIYNTVPTFGAYGYLVNNKNIEKIIEHLSFIDNIIDVQIYKKGQEKKLIVYRIYPTIVDHSNFGTSIRNN
jgi:hypothetical protein